MSFRILIAFGFLIPLSMFGQAEYGSSRNQEALNSLERLLIKYSDKKTPQQASNISGYSVTALLSSLDTIIISPKDEWDAFFLRKEYSSFFLNQDILDDHKRKIFFTDDHFLKYFNHDVFVTIDPIFNLQLGEDFKSDNTIFRNTRGFRLSGNIKKKLFIKSSIFENQAKFLSHIEERIDRRNAIPGQGFYKEFQSSLFEHFRGWDFLNAQTELTYRPSSYFSASIGHGNFFLGQGYSSLLLSDYSDNYFHVELNTSLGIFNYRNIFAELAPTGSSIDEPGDMLAPKKFMATHILSLKPHKNVEFSLFESVVFGRTKNFELQYLNPLILYRVVEQKLDSPDNVLLGIDASLRLKNNTLLYGQLVVDELRINELFKRSGWWANKFGYQFGLKRIDIFNIDHLDILIEYNSVRPYTYSHRRTLDSEEFVVGSYSHYNQELAHPLGANFREAIMLLGYRVDKRWSIYGKLMWAETGKSTLQNFGENILVANDTRVREYDNTIGQGDKTKILQASTVLTYNLIQNYNIDLQFLFRNQTSQSGNNDLKSIYFALSFRANMSNQKLDY